MLIGLGEPFMDRKIFDRIEYCERHNISTLLSTNGTFFDEKTCARLLDTPLEHITLSFDGATKESYEYYRKGANFEKVRDNFVRFARMKHERGAKVQVVVQMVRMERNAGEVDDFIRFWSAIPGVDQVRIKEDETNLLQPEAGHAAQDWKHPCHYLWRGPMYVKHSATCIRAARATCWMAGRWEISARQPLTEIWNSDEMQRMRRLHVAGRGERDRHLLALLHHHSASVAGGRQPDAAWPHGAEVSAVGGAAGLFLETAALVADAAEERPQPQASWYRIDRKYRTQKPETVLPVLRQLHERPHADSSRALRHVRLAVFQPGRAGDVQVDPRNFVRRNPEEHGRGDRSARASADVVQIGELALRAASLYSSSIGICHIFSPSALAAASSLSRNA